LHFFEEQVKKWATRPLCTSIVTLGLKKEYIGDLQVSLTAAEIEMSKTARKKKVSRHTKFLLKVIQLLIGSNCDNLRQFIGLDAGLIVGSWVLCITDDWRQNIG
jgi:hypothetical protein